MVGRGVCGVRSAGLLYSHIRVFIVDPFVGSWVVHTIEVRSE